jgi:hypothetical protein
MAKAEFIAITSELNAKQRMDREVFLGKCRFDFMTSSLKVSID